MARTKLYTVIFGVLFVLATAQAAIEYAGYLDQAYWVALGLIIVLSFVKAVFVAGYYQHLRWEPRSLTMLVVTGLLAVLALMTAASYSIL